MQTSDFERRLERIIQINASAAMHIAPLVDSAQKELLALIDGMTDEELEKVLDELLAGTEPISYVRFRIVWRLIDSGYIKPGPLPMSSLDILQKWVRLYLCAQEEYANVRQWGGWQARRRFRQMHEFERKLRKLVGLEPRKFIEKEDDNDDTI